MIPKLSILIPCYNNGSYLIQLIDGFRHQTSSDWEMLIVDDGSSDDTPQVIRDNIKDLPNVQYMSRKREPKGSVTCRNIGLELSKGKYICHLDADDLVTPTFVEDRVAFMESHPDLDYASFPAKSFYDEANLTPELKEEDEIWGVDNKGFEDMLAAFLQVVYPFSTWCNIYKKESIKDIVWDESFKIYTDFSFIIPCILAGLKHSYSDKKEVDYYYRKTPSANAMTSSFISDEKCESTLRLFERTLNSLEKRADKYKRKNQFKKFLSLHFKRLLKNPNKKNISSYIELLKKHYSFVYVYRYKFVYSLNSMFGYNRYIAKLLDL